MVLLVTAVAVVAVAAATQGDRCSFVSLATTASPTHVPSVHSTPFDPAAMRLLCLCVPRCVVLAVRRFKCGDIEGERGHCGRLFEVTEIATQDDKMLTKEGLSNTS